MIKLLVCSLVTLVVLVSAESRLTPTAKNVTIQPGTLLINEVVASETQIENEFGMTSDWIELYNPGNEDLRLEGGNWFISDKGVGHSDPFELPEVIVPANSYLLIWCDGLDGEFEDIHADFAIDDDGEHLVLIYRPDGMADMIVDEQKLGPQKQNISEGLLRGRWLTLAVPSPGEENGAERNPIQAYGADRSNSPDSLDHFWIGM